jgi:excisionase family DNA binding protein
VSLKSEQLTVRQTAVELGCSAHHVRLLVRRGTLDATGEGTERRITRASLEKYRSGRQRNRDISLFLSAGKEYKKFVQQLLTSLPPLSRTDSAARLLGLMPGEFDELVRSGEVPLIAIGIRRYIPARWLADMIGKAYVEGGPQ